MPAKKHRRARHVAKNGSRTPQPLLVLFSATSEWRSMRPFLSKREIAPEHCQSRVDERICERNQ